MPTIHHSSAQRHDPYLATKQVVLYALPAGSMALLFGGPLVVLQGIYAKYYGLSLATVATVLLIANLFDAITDPVIGYCSDRYHARTGTRKPFILSGGVLFLVGAYYLFVPPDDVSSTYFLVYFLVFYLGFTLFNIPHHAWGSEISYNSKSSIRIFTIRATALSVGGALFYLIPQLPIFETTEFTPQTLKFAVYISGLLILPLLLLCIYLVPDGHQPRSKENLNSIGGLEKNLSMNVLWKGMANNRPFLLFLGAYFLSGLGAGSWGALSFIFIDTYLNMGDQFSLIALIGMGLGALGLQLWSILTIRFGKISAWVASIVSTSIAILCMTLLTPGASSFLLLALIIVPIFVGFISFSAFSTALLSDIVDYTTWKYGGNFTGSIFSIYFLVTKTNVAIGGAMGIAIVGWYGFDPSSTFHDSDSVKGLKIAAIWLPISFLLMSIFFVSRITINTRRHAIICKALTLREKRIARAQLPLSIHKSGLVSEPAFKSQSTS